MPVATRGAAIVALVAGLAAAGCGGDGNRLNRGELHQRANAICKQHGDRINAAVSPLVSGGPPNEAAFARVVKATVVPEYTRQISSLRKLDPPSGLASGYARWLSDSTAVRNRLDRDPRTPTSDPKAFSTVNSEADALGLSKACHAGSE